jgi:hypothetical protein
MFIDDKKINISNQKSYFFSLRSLRLEKSFIFARDSDSWLELHMIKQKYEILEIWKYSIELAKEFCCVAENLDNQHIDKFCEYMKDTCLCLSNSIATITDITPKEDVIHSLTQAHLLTLEVENIVMILFEQQLVNSSKKEYLIQKIQTLDDKISEYKQ